MHRLTLVVVGSKWMVYCCDPESIPWVVSMEVVVVVVLEEQEEKGGCATILACFHSSSSSSYP